MTSRGFGIFVQIDCCSICRGLKIETRGVTQSTGLEATPPAFDKFITAACCSSLGSESGRSMQRLHNGGSWRLMPPVCGFPEASRYEGGVRGACNVSEAFVAVGKQPHTADEAREASPVPPAPAKADRILFSKDHFATRPTNAEIVHPPPAIHANNARITADYMAGLFEVPPAQGTGIPSFTKVSLLFGIVSLQGNHSRNGTSVGILTGL
jgi:hypothetical protein